MNTQFSIRQRQLLLGLVLLLVPVVVPADTTYGWVEKVAIMPWNVVVKAKLDSGALTSSLHAEDIERFERDGESWVRFTVELEDEASGEQFTKRLERPVHRTLIVTGAGGSDRRAVVLMNICIGETVYQEQFSLENRDDLIYPVLLGRRTIQHLGNIDVTNTFLHDADCDGDTTVSGIDERAADEGIGID